MPPAMSHKWRLTDSEDEHIAAIVRSAGTADPNRVDAELDNVSSAASRRCGPVAIGNGDESDTRRERMRYALATDRVATGSVGARSAATGVPWQADRSLRQASCGTARWVGRMRSALRAKAYGGHFRVTTGARKVERATGIEPV